MLAQSRRDVAQALAAAMADPAGAARVTGVGGALAVRARDANLHTIGGPVLPAARRYSGVVWDHLGTADLVTRRRASTPDVLIVSAIGGLFTLDDPVPDYKCSIGTRLPGVGSLAAFWRRHSAEALVAACGDALVWDLLPGDHSRAVDMTASGAARVIRVIPVTASGRAIGHNAKAVKGRFARHVLGARTAASVSGLVRSFAWPGWSARLEGDDVTLVGT
jgi:hypothetical protein